MSADGSGGRNHDIDIADSEKYWRTIYSYDAIQHFTGNEQQTMESGPSVATSSEPVVEQGVLIYV